MNVTCKIANVAVEINYTDEVKEALQIDYLAVNHSRGMLTFEGNDPENEVGYFMMPNGETTLSWTLVGQRKINDGVDPTIYTLSRNITNVQKGYKYVFNITLADEESNQIGGGFFDINVKEEPLSSEESTINVELAPIIKYYGGGSLDEAIRTAPGQVGDQTIMIQASGELKSVVLNCEQLSSILDGNDVDLVQMSDEVGTLLESYIQVSTAYNESKNTSAMYVKLTDLFTSKFEEEGTYTIEITATDSNEQSTTKTATFIITDSPIVVTAFDATSASPSELTATSATVKGTIINENDLPDNPEITVYYTEGEQKSRAEWQTTKAIISSGGFSVNLTGLSPGTTYSYYAETQKADGSYAYTDIDYLTTEPATQLPNNSFEITQGSSPILFYDNDDDMFWDSGNHGSSTLKKNVTVTTTSMYHSGSQALSLESQKVAFLGLGKFAAGNIFAGAYLYTNGTDGELGWGRPFTGRPKQLRVWAHYTPVAIDEIEEDAPAEYVEGEMDRGIIYVALMDSYTESYDVPSDNKNSGIAGQTVNFPVIVKTKKDDDGNRQLFNSESEHVIAYGEHVFEGATTGNQLVEVVVDIDYSKGNSAYTYDNIRPSYIILTASASKGGDYFTGGSGSVLVLDDIELVYE